MEMKLSLSFKQLKEFKTTLFWESLLLRKDNILKFNSINQGLIQYASLIGLVFLKYFGIFYLIVFHNTPPPLDLSGPSPSI